MSMIYECPSCHTPQAAGHTSCPHCGADFEGPVPDDAVVPEPTISVAAVTDTEEKAASLEEASPLSEPPAPEPLPTPEPPSLQAVLPPPEPLPYQPPPLPPYQPPPAYPAPQLYSSPARSLKMDLGQLPKALLIGVPIILVLVLGVVFFTRSLDQGSDVTPLPPAPSTPTPTMSTPAPTPVGAPVTLSGGQATGSNSNSATKFLVGRWQAKSTDFYVFNENGTGSRGTITGKQTRGSFLWVLVQNQLILYADTQEKFLFSPGTDDSSMFLRGQDGKYVQFTRSKTNT